MKLYNTLTKKVEKFTPIIEGKIGLYACGPTVYDYAHIGHLRKFTMDDILIRTLKHEGYDLKFIRNITDVGHLTSDEDTGEDKLEKGARKYNQSVWDIAKKFTDHFNKSMKLMGNLNPNESTKATDHIQDQLDMVIQLEKKGFTYIIENDGVYFDTKKFPEYGKMAQLKLEEQREGARINKVVGKRNPSDFALWKFEREGENRQMSWKSPWSDRGFPGWHIECSAMSMKYLGDQFDIHTGGIDHIPVHHTNEIAQSEAATGKSPFVRFWVHHNFLKVDGVKMSKSLGNFYTIDDVLDRGFHPLALRLLFLTAHYQSEMNFTWENLAGAQKSYEKLLQLVVSLKEESRSNIKESSKNQQYEDQFFTALAENLNTSKALAVLWEVVKADLNNEDKLSLLLKFNEVFQLGFERAEEILKEFEFSKKVGLKEIPQEVSQILENRLIARDNGDWDKADRLRDQLLEKGYKVLDLPEGQKLEKL